MWQIQEITKALSFRRAMVKALQTYATERRMCEDLGGVFFFGFVDDLKRLAHQMPLPDQMSEGTRRDAIKLILDKHHDEKIRNLPVEDLLRLSQDAYVDCERTGPAFEDVDLRF